MTHPVGRYSTDTYYLQTWDALVAANVDPTAFARRHALLLLKPDAAITGAMRPAVSWLLATGYRVVGAYAVNLTWLHIRALWYFNWHRATPERRRLADRLAELSSSVVLVVTHPDDSAPVSIRLTADKGPADPVQRKAGQLRFALSAGTYLLNLVHSADDPDDVLREFGIYFPEPQLVQIIVACASGADASAEAFRIVGGIESAVQRRSGDLAAAQDAIWDELSALGMTTRPQSADEWLSALHDATLNGTELDIWFRTVIESAYLPMHRA
jgi:nucleoside diphosphate kinase